MDLSSWQNPFLFIGLSLVILVVGLGFGFWVIKQKTKQKLLQAEREAKRILEAGNKEIQVRLKEASLKSSEQLAAMKAQLDNESKNERRELLQLEKRLLNREENLEKKLSFIDNKEQELKRKHIEVTRENDEIQKLKNEYNELVISSKRQLEKVANMTADEAKKNLTNIIMDETRHDSAKMARAIEEEAKTNAEKLAKKVISSAIYRYSGEFVSERAVTVVTLPSEEMKGRIIGREGRNIRALEAATGVDLVVDDTPEAVILSSFNPIRREIARRSLEKLISDGRIHPARIEEVVKKFETEVYANIKEDGEQATFDLGLHGIHPEIIKIIGTLKYRYSYTQNQYYHSIEVGYIAGIMAAEVGENVKMARRAGLLHDIGKALDHEIEGGHAMIGSNFAKKHGESQEIWHAIGAHHEDLKPESVLDLITQAADCLSGARPGARREMLDSYVNRIEDIEKVANEFKGVERTFAIQAGREIRVMVNSKEISDESATMLSRDIAKKIEQEVSYPGQIKVTVIREVRSVDYAK